MCILLDYERTGHQIYHKYMSRIIVKTGLHMEAFIEVLLNRFAQDDPEPMNAALKVKWNFDQVDDSSPLHGRIYDLLFRSGASIDVSHVSCSGVAVTGSIEFMLYTLREKADAIVSDESTEVKYRNILNQDDHENVFRGAAMSRNPRLVQFLLNSGAAIKNLSVRETMACGNDNLMRLNLRDVIRPDFEYAFRADNPIANELAKMQITRDTNNHIMRLKLLRYLREKGGEYVDNGTDRMYARMLYAAGFKRERRVLAAVVTWVFT